MKAFFNLTKMAARANVGDLVRTIQGDISLLAGETAQEREEGKPKRWRRHWVQPHIMAHEDHSAHAQLMPVLREQESDVYHNCVRLSPALFCRHVYVLLSADLRLPPDWLLGRRLVLFAKIHA